MKYLVLFILALTIFSKSSFCEPVRIIAPYQGTIENYYDSRFSLKDTSTMRGLYAQWIEPEKYQSNIFLYGASNINFSNLLGMHFIFDYYYIAAPNFKYVLGAGIELISLDMDAGSGIPGLSDFSMENDIYITYFRLGEDYTFKFNRFNLSIFPWFGLENQYVKGETSFGLSGISSIKVKEDISENDVFTLAGINLKAEIDHFIDIKLKYSFGYHRADSQERLSIMFNLYFSRNLGVSYRYKDMETDYGYNRYHIGGIVYSF